MPTFFITIFPSSARDLIVRYLLLLRLKYVEGISLSLKSFGSILLKGTSKLRFPVGSIHDFDNKFIGILP